MKLIATEEIKRAHFTTCALVTGAGDLFGNQGVHSYLHNLGVEKPREFGKWTLRELGDPVTAAIYTAGFAAALEIFKSREQDAVNGG